MEDLRHGAHWRLAVWGARVMGRGLAVVVAGFVVLVWPAGTGKVILAFGAGICLAGLVLTLAGVRWACGGVQPPRPGCARVRQALLHDALHAGSQAGNTAR